MRWRSAKRTATRRRASRWTPRLTLNLGLRWELYPTRTRSAGMGIECDDDLLIEPTRQAFARSLTSVLDGGVQDGPNIPFTVPYDHAPVTFSYDAATHVLTVSAPISRK